MCEIDLFQIAFQCCLGICLWAFSQRIACLQVCKSYYDRVSRFLACLSDGKPTIGCFAIPTSDLMNNPDSVLVPAFAHEELWRLEYLEDNKAQKELNHTDPTHDDDEIAPTHIPGTSTGSTLLASQVAQ